MTPRESAVAEEILRLAREELELDADLSPEEELAGRLDSVKLLALVVAVEDRFRVILRDEDAARARSLADLARLVVAGQDSAARAGEAP